MEWFERWFNKDYLKVYAHRDESRAKHEAMFAVEASGFGRSDCILDVACGSGRHLKHLTGSVKSAIGLDLSYELLAKARSDGLTTVVRGDMRRLPFRDGTFEGLTCFFTAFGYFSTDDQHETLLVEWRRVLKPGGKLFLDYLNSAWVIRNLEPLSERSYHDFIIREQRFLSSDHSRLEKSIRLQAPDGKVREYRESVRLYTLEEMRKLFFAAGFKIDRESGDFTGEKVGSDSPRLIIIAQSRDTTP